VTIPVFDVLDVLWRGVLWYLGAVALLALIGFIVESIWHDD